MDQVTAMKFYDSWLELGSKYFEKLWLKSKDNSVSIGHK